MSAVRIGQYTLRNNLILAPMAGVTDQPFRTLCQRLGAGMVVSEMVSSDMNLWNSRKSSLRRIHEGDPEPRSVQIAGGDAQMMAAAARANVEAGAQSIDINMGCPAKKVCNKAAGSALLKDEALVHEILHAVVGAVDVPVTLKIRTGWARAVLDATGVDGLLIGRAAQGRPWIFREIEHYLRTGEHLPAPQLDEVEHILLQHLAALHAFYGDVMGVRIARKHVGWYLATRPGGKEFRSRFNALEDTQAQCANVRAFFSERRQSLETEDGQGVAA